MPAALKLVVAKVLPWAPPAHRFRQVRSSLLKCRVFTNLVGFQKTGDLTAGLFLKHALGL
jgi:hypothetical protein